MLGIRPARVKPRSAALAWVRPAARSSGTDAAAGLFARAGPSAADWPPAPPRCSPVNPTLPVLLVLTALAFTALVWQLLRSRRRRAMHRLLDAADALEARLRAARAEITAIAGELDADPVGDAMREMLRQRLWLREQGPQAKVAELHRVRATIDQARDRIEGQLTRVNEARALEH